MHRVSDKKFEQIRDKDNVWRCLLNWHNLTQSIYTYNKTYT